MAKLLTKDQLIELRRKTYTPPPVRRCANCRHYWPYSHGCQAIVSRGYIYTMAVDPAGCCDLFNQKEEKR